MGVGFAQAQDATKVAFPKGYGASADWVRYAVINNFDENTRRDLVAPAGLAEVVAFRSTGGRLSSADIDGCHGCHEDAADNDFVFSLGKTIGAGG